MRRWVLCVIATTFFAFLLSSSATAKPEPSKPDDPAHAAANAGTSPSDFANKMKDEHKDWVVAEVPTPGIAQILTAAVDAFKSYRQKSPCEGSAASTAWAILNDAANNAPLIGMWEEVKTAIKRVYKVAKIGADPSAGAELVRVGEEAEKYLKGAGAKAGKKEVLRRLKNFWKGKPKEVYSKSGKKAGCDFVLFVIWDRADESYEVLVYGDCHCKSMTAWDWPPPEAPMPPLNTWFVRLTGKVVPDEDQGEWVYDVKPNYGALVHAVCKKCDGKNETPSNPPPGGTTTPGDPGRPGPNDGSKLKWADRKAKCADCDVILSQLKEAEKEREAIRLKIKDLQDRITAAEKSIKEANDRIQLDKDRLAEKETQLAADRAALSKISKKKNSSKWQTAHEQVRNDEAAIEAIRDHIAGQEGLIRDHTGVIETAMRLAAHYTAEDAALIAKMNKLAADLYDCEKNCPKDKHASSGRAPEMPIFVGSNSDVGSGARLQNKLLSTAAGVLGGFLGGGGGGHGGGGPKLAKCHIDDANLTLFDDPASGIALKMAAKRNGDIVDVYASIDKSPDSGTFQTSYLENAAGEREAPADLGICKLWGEWSVSVSWTKTTYVNDKMVSRESGGWSKAGSFNLPGFVSTKDAPDGYWKRLGFSNASHGARQIVMHYKLPPAGDAANLIVHVTRPGGDPVTTTPFVMRMTETPEGIRFAPEQADVMN